MTAIFSTNSSQKQFQRIPCETKSDEPRKTGNPQELRHANVIDQGQSGLSVIATTPRTGVKGVLAARERILRRGLEAENREGRNSK